MFKTLWFGKALLLQCQLLHAVLHVQGVWLGWSTSIRGKVTLNSIVSLYGQSSLEVWCGHLEMYCQQIKLAWWKAWNLIEDIHHTLIASTYRSGSICVPVHSFPLHSAHVMEDHRAGSSEALCIWHPPGVSQRIGADHAAAAKEWWGIWWAQATKSRQSQPLNPWVPFFLVAWKCLATKTLFGSRSSHQIRFHEHQAPNPSFG